jgi:hypothetical protein
MNPTVGDRDYKRHARQLGSVAGALAAALLIGGFLLATEAHGGAASTGRDMVGYGIGVAVAAAFMFAGFNPLDKRRK